MLLTLNQGESVSKLQCDGGVASLFEFGAQGWNRAQLTDDDLERVIRTRDLKNS